MSKKRGYTFGLEYMQRLRLRYSYKYGWYCQDHYSTWLVNMTPKDTK